MRAKVFFKAKIGEVKVREMEVKCERMEKRLRSEVERLRGELRMAETWNGRLLGLLGLLDAMVAARMNSERLPHSN